jgi:adenine-specific DNA-methyltransferase
MKTELVWEVKYDEYGAHRPMDIAGSAMPFMEMEFLRRTLLQSWR